MLRGRIGCEWGFGRRGLYASLAVVWLFVELVASLGGCLWPLLWIPGYTSRQTWCVSDRLLHIDVGFIGRGYCTYKTGEGTSDAARINSSIWYWRSQKARSGRNIDIHAAALWEGERRVRAGGRGAACFDCTIRI